MTVSLDTISQVVGSGAGGTTLSWSHTVASGANLITVGTGATKATSGSQAVTAMTYNGVSLSRVTSAIAKSTNTGSAELWGLANPAIGANTISVTFATGVRAVGFGASFFNVSGIQANGANDYLIAVLGGNDGAHGISVSGPNVSAWTTQGNGATLTFGALDTVRASATSSTLTFGMSASNSPWGIAAVALLADSGGAGPSGGGAFFFSAHSPDVVEQDSERR